MSCKIWGYFQFSYVVTKHLFESMILINQAVRDVLVAVMYYEL